MLPKAPILAIAVIVMHNPIKIPDVYQMTKKPNNSWQQLNKGKLSKKARRK